MNCFVQSNDSSSAFSRQLLRFCYWKRRKLFEFAAILLAKNRITDGWQMTLSEVGNKLIDLETRLASNLRLLQYPENVEYIYNPMSYAISTHKQYVIKYANESPKQILFLGMNPGPWGMAQTGRLLSG